MGDKKKVTPVGSSTVRSPRKIKAKPVSVMPAVRDLFKTLKEGLSPVGEGLSDTFVSMARDFGLKVTPPKKKAEEKAREANVKAEKEKAKAKHQKLASSSYAVFLRDKDYKEEGKYDGYIYVSKKEFNEQLAKKYNEVRKEGYISKKYGPAVQYDEDGEWFIPTEAYQNLPEKDMRKLHLAALSRLMVDKGLMNEKEWQDLFESKPKDLEDRIRGGVIRALKDGEPQLWDKLISESFKYPGGDLVQDLREIKKPTGKLDTDKQREYDEKVYEFIQDFHTLTTEKVDREVYLTHRSLQRIIDQMAPRTEDGKPVEPGYRRSFVKYLLLRTHLGGRTSSIVPRDQIYIPQLFIAYHRGEFDGPGKKDLKPYVVQILKKHGLDKYNDAALKKVLDDPTAVFEIQIKKPEEGDAKFWVTTKIDKKKVDEDTRKITTQMYGILKGVRPKDSPLTEEQAQKIRESFWEATDFDQFWRALQRKEVLNPEQVKKMGSKAKMGLFFCWSIFKGSTGEGGLVGLAVKEVYGKVQKGEPLTGGISGLLSRYHIPLSSETREFFNENLAKKIMERAFDSDRATLRSASTRQKFFENVEATFRSLGFDLGKKGLEEALNKVIVSRAVKIEEASDLMKGFEHVGKEKRLAESKGIADMVLKEWRQEYSIYTTLESEEFIKRAYGELEELMGFNIPDDKVKGTATKDGKIKPQDLIRAKLIAIRERLESIRQTLTSAGLIPQGETTTDSLKEGLLVVHEGLIYQDKDQMISEEQKVAHTLGLLTNDKHGAGVQGLIKGLGKTLQQGVTVSDIVQLMNDPSKEKGIREAAKKIYNDYLALKEESDEEYKIEEKDRPFALKSPVKLGLSDDGGFLYSYIDKKVDEYDGVLAELLMGKDSDGESIYVEYAVPGKIKKSFDNFGFKNIKEEMFNDWKEQRYIVPASEEVVNRFLVFRRARKKPFDEKNLRAMNRIVGQVRAAYAEQITSGHFFEEQKGREPDPRLKDIIESHGIGGSLKDILVKEAYEFQDRFKKYRNFLQSEKFVATGGDKKFPHAQYYFSGLRREGETLDPFPKSMLLASVPEAISADDTKKLIEARLNMLGTSFSRRKALVASLYGEDSNLYKQVDAQWRQLKKGLMEKLGKLEVRINTDSPSERFGTIARFWIDAKKRQALPGKIFLDDEKEGKLDDITSDLAIWFNNNASKLRSLYKGRVPDKDEIQRVLMGWLEYEYKPYDKVVKGILDRKPYTPEQIWNDPAKRMILLKAYGLYLASKEYPKDLETEDRVETLQQLLGKQLVMFTSEPDITGDNWIKNSTLRGHLRDLLRFAVSGYEKHMEIGKEEGEQEPLVGEPTRGAPITITDPRRTGYEVDASAFLPDWLRNEALPVLQRDPDQVRGLLGDEARVDRENLPVVVGYIGLEELKGQTTRYYQAYMRRQEVLGRIGKDVLDKILRPDFLTGLQSRFWLDPSRSNNSAFSAAYVEYVLTQGIPEPWPGEPEGERNDKHLEDFINKKLYGQNNIEILKGIENSYKIVYEAYRKVFGEDALPKLVRQIFPGNDVKDLDELVEKLSNVKFPTIDPQAKRRFIKTFVQRRLSVVMYRRLVSLRDDIEDRGLRHLTINGRKDAINKGLGALGMVYDLKTDTIREAKGKSQAASK